MLENGEQTIKDLLDDNGISYRSNQKSFILTCPKCEKKDKLYIRKADGRFACWVCKETEGFQGSPEFGLSAILNQPINDIRTKLYGTGSPQAKMHLNIQLKDFFENKPEEQGIETEILPEFMPGHEFVPISHKASLKGLRYLESRGIPEEVAKEYDLHFCPRTQRVIFPVKGEKYWVGWQGRYIHPELMPNGYKISKIITKPGFKKDKALMFSERISGTHAVLTEGPIDAIHCHLVGGNVCSMGKAVSEYQLELIKNCGITRLYIGLDPDAATDIKRITNRLSPYMEIFDMRPLGHKDIGEMDFQSVLELYKSAQKITKSTLIVYFKKFYD